MTSARRALVTGGFLGGTSLGVLIGVVEASASLRPFNWSASPFRSLLFLVDSAAVYALVFGTAGAVLALLLRSSSRRGRHSRRPLDTVSDGAARGFSFSVGALVAFAAFVVGVWRVRKAPPDLAVFRNYCLPETAIVLLLSVLVGVLGWFVLSKLARRRLASGILASSRTTLVGCSVLIALSAALVATLVVERGAGAPAQPRDEAAPNVILFTIDTLRPDRVAPWGHDGPTSPAVSELASRSIVFEQAVVQQPLTTPSHASILTSRYPRSHGAVDNAVPIHESAVLLSEVLRTHGYSTAGFVTIGFVGAKYGFDRGFGHFVEMNGGNLEASLLTEWIAQLRVCRLAWRCRSLDASTVAAERWIARRHDSPFFAWIHQYAPHTPYSPPFRYEREWDRTRSRLIPTSANLSAINAGEREMSSDDRAHTVSLYDGEIAYTDGMVERILAALERSGQEGNTLVVFTADHGECLYDRQSYWGHGDKLYDEEVMVPLLFSAPWRLESGVSVRAQVQSIDIAPTIMDFLGLPSEKSFQGESLIDLLEPPGATAGATARARDARDRPAFSVAAGSRMVRHAGWKYIEHDDPSSTPEYYDLRNDPGETNNLIAELPNEAGELAAILAAWNRSVPSVRSESYDRDEEALRALRSLGYIN